ncbi:MAG: 3-methyl-2-oxobutanoate hydroxymethyltransferase, partial [Proteobacteria bacterium]|nr:3-methyl-2-oxobutanoate hydroxymethyltransferase [Pseudomonadota bacterium]
MPVLPGARRGSAGPSRIRGRARTGTAHRRRSHFGVSVLDEPVRTRRTTVPDLQARKGGIPIVSLTAYTTPMARLLDAQVDMLLVGDSLGMVLYGM